MSQVSLQFLGSGDAFGSGGRFQTCFLLRGASGDMLIDCGASSLIAMRRAQIDPSEIGWVLLSHLHGDHFGGLPFLIVDGQFNRRTRPLVIVGPPGVRARVEAAMEVFLPGSASIARRFATEFIELSEREAYPVGPATVTPFAVQHVSGAPSYALRVAYEGKVIAYSGDTEWTESLVDAARGVDLFICEAYFFEKKIKYHLDYRTLREQRGRLACGRLILTHMSQDMLSRLAEVEFECADDGQIVVL
ncbi:MAG: MBL fold metallo-hydrolase [Candidatus Entotheonellia bacterium]